MATSNNSFCNQDGLKEKTACFHFSTDLQGFLAHSDRGRPTIFSFKGQQSVKHLIEAAGVPHTEIGLLRANQRQIGLDYIVQDQDCIEVFSIYDHPQETPECVTAKAPKFILDNHLGKLATYLRMLGFDCLYDNQLSDQDLAHKSTTEGRILLTRDRRLLMRKIVHTGYFVRSKEPLDQAAEIIRRFNLYDKIQPFRRCLRCNHILEPVEKASILHRLQPKTRLYYEKFHICPRCDQIYWQGSHYERMLEMIQTILAP